MNRMTLVPRYDDLRTPLDEALRVAGQLQLPIELEAIPFCVVPNHPAAVGEVRLLGAGRTLFRHVRRLMRDWERVRVESKRKGPRCNACFFDDACEGVWSEYEALYGSDELRPVHGTEEDGERLRRVLDQVAPGWRHRP